MRFFSRHYAFEALCGIWLALLLAGLVRYPHVGWNLFFLMLSLLALFMLFKFTKREASEQLDPAPVPDKQYLVFFVIGPYAARWFNNSETSDDESEASHAIWITAPDAQDLVDRMTIARNKYKNATFMTYFPFLPDGHVSTESLLSQLAQWQQALSSLAERQPISCMLAFYAQLSLERLSWDPDRALWAGNADISCRNEMSLEAAREVLFAELRKQCAGNNLFAMQRYSLSQTLFTWLDESKIFPALNSLFRLPGVRLNSLLIADYGSGFARHGAWSRWLQEKYGMLPPLSKASAGLPFPVVHYDEYALVHHNENETAIIYAKPVKKWPARLWGGVFIIMLSMAFAAWTEMSRNKEVKGKLEQFNDIDSTAWQQQSDAYDNLKKERERLASCQRQPAFLNWGFTRCAQLITQVDSEMKDFSTQALYRATQSLSLFEAGKADILPSRENDLQALLPLLTRSASGRFLIIGHADSTGSPQSNMQLSLLRAKTVRDFLVAHSGLPEKNFIIQGVGDTQPATSEDSDAARDINRRVEIVPLMQYQNIN